MDPAAFWGTSTARFGGPTEKCHLRNNAESMDRQYALAAASTVRSEFTFTWLEELVSGQIGVVGVQLRSPVELRLERIAVLGVNQLQRTLVNDVRLNTHTRARKLYVHSVIVT